MKIIEVKNRKLFEAFLSVPSVVYSDDPKYIWPLHSDLRQILGPDNPHFNGDNLKLFLALTSRGYVGRLAAFHYPGNSKGGIGFFESIPDSSVARALFEKGEEFLKKRGCTHVEAPVNFGERDKFWGLMISRFDSPSYQENYNPPYYRDLFEQNGYREEFEQITWEISPETFNKTVLKRKADQLKLQGFTWRHYDPSYEDQFIEDFKSIYNAAWEHFEHFKPLQSSDLRIMLKRMKPIFRNNLLWFTYNPEGKAIGLYLSVVDLNQYLCGLNGKLNLWNRMRLLIRLKMQPVRKIRGLVFGVIPEYQNRGVAAGMIMEICNLIEADPNIPSTELAWVGGFNPRMMDFLVKLGAMESRRHSTLIKKV